MLDWVQAYREAWGQTHKKTWLKTQTGWAASNKYKLPGDGNSVLSDHYQHRLDNPQSKGALVDLNGDGLPDWVLAYKYDKTKKTVVQKTWLNNGRGFDTSPNSAYKLPEVLTDVSRFSVGERHGTFADLNGDGLMDWIVAWRGNYHAGDRRVWINRGKVVNGSIWKLETS
jgi:hypothetical protein